MATTWKTTLPCSKQDAEALSEDVSVLADLDPPPALMTSEPDPARPDDMELAVYTEAEPDAAFLSLLQRLLPTSPRAEPVVEPLPDADWVTLSQQGLDPVEAGRFVVHTASDAALVTAGRIGIAVEASRAFGTGHHPTTAGCLRAIDALTQAPSNTLDLGCGTALLAIGVAKAFPASRIVASDIDEPSIDVARETLAANGIVEGREPGQIELFACAGIDPASIGARAPYDLVIANILAAPLIELAADVAGVLAPGGTLILAGLLTDQAEAVADAYRGAGLDPVDADPNQGWPVLTFTRTA
ncbi:MAG: 50S ribosomal protein L11 methyltransferase [Pacificimonas sp.]|jgi:ribosomal protein L11 methyltransferase|nr:50S ribosomal protein L11 methyltransferase [Pacificimonas sp.]